MNNLDTKYLYHYTSMPTLFNIFDKYNKGDKKIVFRASHIDFLNDPLESLIFGEIVSKYFNTLSSFAELLTLTRKYITSDGEYAYNFVLSFSSLKDDLIMYRTYSNNAQGISLEFDIAILKSILSEGMCRHKDDLIKCIYIDEINDNNVNEILDNSHKEKINHLISQIAKGFSESKDNNNMNINIPMSDDVADVLSILPVKYKHKAFENEGEYRFVALKSLDKANFIHRNGLMIPYVNVEIPIEAITKITIAPCANADKELSKKSLVYFLESKGLKIPIEVSKQPYTIR